MHLIGGLWGRLCRTVLQLGPQPIQEGVQPAAVLQAMQPLACMPLGSLRQNVEEQSIGSFMRCQRSKRGTNTHLLRELPCKYLSLVMRRTRTARTARAPRASRCCRAGRAALSRCRGRPCSGPAAWRCRATSPAWAVRPWACPHLIPFCRGGPRVGSAAWRCRATSPAWAVCPWACLHLKFHSIGGSLGLVLRPGGAGHLHLHGLCGPGPVHTSHIIMR